MSLHLLMSCFLLWMPQPFQDTPTIKAPDDLVMFGVTAERVNRSGLKKNLFSNKIWVLEDGEWKHPWSFKDEATGTNWNLFVSIDRVIADKKKVAFTGLVNHVRKVKFGLFLYEPGKEIRPLLLYDMSSFLGTSLNLPEPYLSWVKEAYDTKLATWKETPSEFKWMYKRVFSRTYFRQRQELTPIGWLADGQTILLWRPKKLLFVPINGDPPRLVELKDLRSQVPDWEGDRFRVAFGNKAGVAPVLANNRNLYQIQNDGQVVPWQKRTPQPEVGLMVHQASEDSMPFGEEAPDRLQVLFGGTHFHWDKRIVNQHLEVVWDLGKANHVVRTAVNNPVVAVSYYGKKQIKVRNLASADKEKVFKFKTDTVDMALNDNGDTLAVALFGKQKKKYINDIELINVKTGERKQLGLTFLPYLQSLSEKIGDEASRMAFSEYFLDKNFKKHGFFPKLFAAGDTFYFKGPGQLNAVGSDGVIKETGIVINSFMLWDAFLQSRPLFPDYRRFMKVHKQPGFTLSVTIPL